MPTDRKGFTMIELIVVVIIIVLLAAIALPRYAATKDKSRLAALKTDVRNAETAEEAYFTNFATFGTLAQLQAAGDLSVSTGNTMTISAVTNGFTITASSPSITSGITSCSVQVAGGVASTLDAQITCP